MSDYFGYNKTTKGPDSIASANMLMFSTGKGRVNLAQSVNINYKREASYQYELGSESVWLLAGRSGGSCEVNRAVGEEKLLKPWKVDDPCGTTSLFIGKGVDSCGLDPGVITMTECLLISVGIQANVNQLTVTDSASWMIGKLEDS